MKGGKRTHRSQLRFYLPLGVLVALGFLFALRFVEPAPPRQVVIAAGEPGGAYMVHAQRYAALLAKEGIVLKVLRTSGSVENLELLEQGKVDLAFVQGGVAERQSRDGALRGLASLYYEPLWLFVREGLALPGRIPALKRLEISLGPEGSGTRVLVSQLFLDNGLPLEGEGLLALPSPEAAGRLKSGEIDAAFFVASPASATVRELLHHPGVRPVSFERAAAYARRYSWLRELVLPEGAEDLARNLPDRDLHLLATTASLLTREELHPAIVSLFMQVLKKEHGDGGWFEAPGEFPSARYLSVPLDEEARRFYDHGPPFLQRYLPFWAASFIDRMKIMLLPMLGLLLPLFKVAPPLYRWRMRARIYRWYDELEEVDQRAVTAPAEALDGLLATLRRLEEEVRDVKVPLAFSDQLYHLRLHIDFVRREVRRRLSRPALPGGSDFGPATAPESGGTAGTNSNPGAGDTAGRG